MPQRKIFSLRRRREASFVLLRKIKDAPTLPAIAALVIASLAIGPALAQEPPPEVSAESLLGEDVMGEN
jgi:hypothetical protein